MNKNIKLFIIITLLTLLVGWSICSLYVIIRDKGRYDTLTEVKTEIFEEVGQELYQEASNAIVTQIISRIQSNGEIIINTPEGQLTLVKKVVSDNLIQNNDEK